MKKDGSVGCVRFEGAKATRTRSEDGREIVLIEGMTGEEMMRPENRDAAVQFVRRLKEMAGDVDLVFADVSAADAAEALLMAARVKARAEESGRARSPSAPLVDAGQRLVDGLFGEKSGIRVRTGTPEEAEAALRAAGETKPIKDAEGQVQGYYHRGKGEVVLFEGADAGTLAHEIGWHAVRHWAERNSPDLLLKMKRYAARAPLMLKALIKEKYGDFSGDALMDEIGAGRFEREMGERFQKLLAKSPEVRGWWRKVLHALARAWKGMARTVGGNRIDLKKIEKMEPEEAIEALTAQMLEGRRLGEGFVAGEGKRLQIVDVGGVKVPTVTDIKEAEKIHAKSPESVKGYIMQHLEDNIALTAGGTASITETTAHHYGWSPYNFATSTKGTLRKARARMATILSEILGQTKADGSTQEKKPDKNGVGWRCTMPIGVPVLDNRKNVVDMVVYDADVIVKDQGHGKFLYDITRLKKNAVLTPGLANQRNSLFGGGTQSAASGATALGNAPTPHSIPQSGGGAQGEIRPSIAGRKGAEKLGVGKAADAEAMEKAGASREEIWRKTGWWRAKDGKWRVELPSTKMKDARALYAALIEGHNETTLGKILDAPELFEAYPQLKDTKIILSPDKVNPGEAAGWYDRIKNEIVLLDAGLVSLKEMPARERDLRDTYQKVLDSDEFVRRRFADMDAIGIEHGTVEEEREYARWWIERQDKGINRTNEARIRDLANDRKVWSVFGKIIHEVQHAVQRIEGFATGASGDEEGYSRFTGEVEARNAARREAMTPEERAATPPWATEDVPEDRQIIRFSRKKEDGKDNQAIGADMSEPENAKAFRKYLSTREAAPMPERLKDGRPQNALKWFAENMVGRTFEFDIPGIGHREFRVKPGHLFRLVCDTPKEKQASGKNIKKGHVGKAKDAEEARRLIEAGEVATSEIAGWNEKRARSLPLIPEIMESFDAVFREKARPGFLVFVKKFVSKNGHVNTVVMRLNEDGETLGPMSAHMKGITAEWLKGQDLAITNDGKVFTRQENSASSQADVRDNAEGTSLTNAESIPQNGGGAQAQIRPSIKKRDEVYDDVLKAVRAGGQRVAAGRSERTDAGWDASANLYLEREGQVEKAPDGSMTLALSEMIRAFRALSANKHLPKVLEKMPHLASRGRDGRLRLNAAAFGIVDRSNMEAVKAGLKKDGLFLNEDPSWRLHNSYEEVRAMKEMSEQALAEEMEGLAEARIKGKMSGGGGPGPAGAARRPTSRPAEGRLARRFCSGRRTAGAS